MASNLKFSTTVRNTLANAMGALWAGGTLTVYDSAPPANPQTTYTGNALVTITLPTPAFGAAVVGVISKSGVWSAVVSISGTAAGFRMTSSDSTQIIDGTAGIAGDTPDLVFDNKVLVAGGTVSDSTFSFTQPE